MAEPGHIHPWEHSPLSAQSPLASASALAQHLVDAHGEDRSEVAAVDAVTLGDAHDYHHRKDDYTDVQGRRHHWCERCDGSGAVGGLGLNGPGEGDCPDCAGQGEWFD